MGKKVELPSFEGHAHSGGSQELRNYLRFNKFLLLRSFVIVSMEGASIHWFCFWCQKNPNSSWDSFTLDLIQRLGDRTGGGVFEKLATIKQESIEEYV